MFHFKLMSYPFPHPGSSDQTNLDHLLWCQQRDLPENVHLFSPNVVTLEDLSAPELRLLPNHNQIRNHPAISYAALLLRYSRTGEYLFFPHENVWLTCAVVHILEAFAPLNTDFYLAMDPLCFDHIPLEVLENTIVEDFPVGGHVYPKARYDLPIDQPSYLDSDQVFHCDWTTQDDTFEFLWPAHLPELLDVLRKYADSAIPMIPRPLDSATLDYISDDEASFPPSVPTIPDSHLPNFRLPDVERDLFICANDLNRIPKEKYSTPITFARQRDGTVLVYLDQELIPPEKWSCPSEWLYEYKDRPPRENNLSSITLVWDALDQFHSRRDFYSPLLFGLEDDGQNLTLFSPSLAARRTLEFIGDSPLLPDDWEFSYLCPDTNPDMFALLSGLWGQRFGEKYRQTRQEWKERRLASRSAPPAENPPVADPPAENPPAADWPETGDPGLVI